jgi:spermidine synthase
VPVSAQGNRMTTLDLPTICTQRSMLPTRTRLVCVLFFFSGFPALIYQLTWQRELFRIFGVNTESVTLVVTNGPACNCCRCWRQSRS